MSLSLNPQNALIPYQLIATALLTRGRCSFTTTEEALFVFTSRAFPILRLADLTLDTALPIDASFK